jgi:hypothetical protein
VPSLSKQQAFVKAAGSPRILFSEQLGEARADYKAPASTYLWTHYLDSRGQEVALPRYAAITSKGGGTKHFAIVCKRDLPIQPETIHFDIGLFGNFGGSENIAFQQTAPIVEPNPNGRPRKLYSKGFWADLVSPYFATLCRHRQLTLDEAEKIRAAMSAHRTTVEQFKQLLDELKHFCSTSSDGGIAPTPPSPYPAT